MEFEGLTMRHQLRKFKETFQYQTSDGMDDKRFEESSRHYLNFQSKKWNTLTVTRNQPDVPLINFLIPGVP